MFIDDLSTDSFEGPAIVTKDEVEDPHNLRLQCLVNGISKQDSNTNQVTSLKTFVSEHTSKFTVHPVKWSLF